MLSIKSFSLCAGVPPFSKVGMLNTSLHLNKTKKRNEMCSSMRS